MGADPNIPGTFAAFQIVPLLEAAQALGIDPQRLLARANVQADSLRDPRCRLPAGAEFALWDALEGMTNDPLIALRVGDGVRVGALGAYEYLVRNSTSIRAAVERANRFELVIDDLTRISLVETRAEAALRMWREGSYPHPPRGVECLFTVLVRIGRQQFGDSAVREVRFAHAAPAGHETFEERFGCPVRFEQPNHEVVFPLELVDRPMPGVDPRLGNVLEDHLEQVLQTLPRHDPFVHRARSALQQLLPSGKASVDGLASSMGVSPRTLRRRFEHHGTSYKLLLDELRHELALRYVEASDEPFDQIAIRLGFSEPSTFYRAFKRWSGTTPAAHRANRAGES